MIFYGQFRLCTYLSMEQSLSSEANPFSASKEILAFYGTQSSLMYAQLFATRPYPEPARSSL